LFHVRVTQSMIYQIRARASNQIESKKFLKPLLRQLLSSLSHSFKRQNQNEQHRDSYPSFLHSARRGLGDGEAYEEACSQGTG